MFCQQPGGQGPDDSAGSRARAGGQEQGSHCGFMRKEGCCQACISERSVYHSDGGKKGQPEGENQPQPPAPHFTVLAELNFPGPA